MKFTVERDVLAEAVGWTARLPAPASYLPVLNGLLITAFAGEVSIASFDRKTSAPPGYRRRFVQAEGVCLVPGKIPGRNLPFLPNAEVEFTADESVIRLHCRSANFQRPACPWPITPSCPACPKVSGTVDGAEFAESRQAGSDCGVQGRDLALLTGIRVEINGDTMTPARHRPLPSSHA